MREPETLRVLPDPVPAPLVPDYSAAREQLALCLIVHNEPKRLDRCLSSFGPIVSEIVVVHATGATPRDEAVAAVAHKHRAIYGIYANDPDGPGKEWPHVDHFAAARQKSFDLASKPWAIWADADDVAGEDFALGAWELVAKHGEKFDAFALPHNVAGRGIAHNMRERIVKRAAGRWQNAIHENFVISDPSRLATADAPEVVHLPDNEAKQGSGRNLRILLSIPESGRTVEEIYHLHGEYMAAGDKERAVLYAREALRHKECREVERYELCLNLCELSRPPIVETNSTEYRAMMAALHQAYSISPHRREALALLGALHLDIGDAVRAEAYLRAMLALPAPARPPWTHRAALYGWAGESLWTQFLRLAGRTETADAIEAERIAKLKGAPTISICHPTRGRPEQAAAVRKMWLDSAADGERIEHIFAFEPDGEDAQTLCRFRHATLPAGLLGRPSGNCVLANNAAARAAKGEILIFIGDDMPRPPLHWDKAISDELRPYLGQPAMLKLSDGVRGDDLVVTPCVTRETLAALGYGGGIYCEDYASMYADTELSVRAAEQGWLVPSKVVIPHDHPAHNPGMPVHETTARNNSLHNYRNGLATFERRNKAFCDANPAMMAQMRGALEGMK